MIQIVDPHLSHLLGMLYRELDIFRGSEPSVIGNQGGKALPGYSLQQPTRDGHGRGSGWRADESSWRNDFKPPPGMAAPGEGQLTRAGVDQKD